MEKEGQMRVWWKPQVPMNATFFVNVEDTDQAMFILKMLADYDMFQLRNKIKTDYCNTGGLEVFMDGDWEEWFDPDTGYDIDDLVAEGRVMGHLVVCSRCVETHDDLRIVSVRGWESDELFCPACFAEFRDVDDETEFTDLKEQPK